MAASKIIFKCNDSWYVQVDGLAMGAFLAVILANLWLKVFMCDIRPEWPKCNLCRIRILSSKPSELMISKD